jgi:hypothetical protein
MSPPALRTFDASYDCVGLQFDTSVRKGNPPPQGARCLNNKYMFICIMFKENALALVFCTGEDIG